MADKLRDLKIMLIYSSIDDANLQGNPIHEGFDLVNYDDPF